MSTNKRHTIYPIMHPDLWERYKNLRTQVWQVSGADFSNDNWGSLTPNQQNHLKLNLAFFAVSDSVVADNLAQKFAALEEDIIPKEAQFFYAYQLDNECVHSEMYSIIINEYFKTERERNELFNAATQIPAVKKKMAWANKWLDSESIEERLIAFAGVEGILFATTFASVFIYKALGKQLDGLYWANQEISRDECYSKDTKVLTTKGFKLFSELTMDDLILQYTEEGLLQPVKPLSIIKKNYKGVLYNGESTNSKFAVTENHDFLIKQEYGFSKQQIKEVDFTRNAITLGDFEEVKLSDFKITKTPYDDVVYCCTVPSGMIVTQLEGKTYIGANCTHYEFATHLYNSRFKGNLSNSRITDILLEACEVEKEFVRNCFEFRPEGFIEFDMLNYVEYVTDTLLINFGCQPYYNAKPNMVNEVMKGIATPMRENFFETRTTKYSQLTDTKFEITDDF